MLDDLLLVILPWIFLFDALEDNRMDCNILNYFMLVDIIKYNMAQD